MNKTVRTQLGLIIPHNPRLLPLRYLAALLLLCLAVSIALANQTSSGSAQDGAQAGPTTMNYPSPLTMQVGRTGTPVTIADAAAALNSIGAVTSAQLSPAIAATTNATVMNVSADGCVLSTGRCANRGTMTFTFNRAVTNPVLHISGLGGNQGANLQYHASMILTSWVAAATPTLTLTNNNGNMQVSGSEIRVTTINGGTNCSTAPVAGCGSVRINGTVTSVTFQMDLLTAGTGTPTAANIDAFTITASVDEDFGDAPAAYETGAPASHVVGGLYLGSGVTADNVAVSNGGTQVSPFPSANASTDTDNGVTGAAPVRGQTTITNVAVTGSGGLLQAWIDWGDDGSFATAGDRVATNAVDGGAGDSDGTVNGVIALSVPVPLTAALTETIARFRFSSTSNLNFTGLAPDGEVEDYAVTVQAPPYSDLSLTKTVSNAAPVSGSNITYTLQVSNAGAPSLSASSVAVTDILPMGTTFVSATGTGTYNSSNGIWSVGTLAAGASASITITVNVTATGGATVTNSAEVSASSSLDIDSTVNNGSTTEDDYAQVSFTVAGGGVAGTPPTLVCPVGSTLFDWDARAWTAGSVSNSYTVTNFGTVSFALTNQGAWVNDAARGGQSPTRNNATTGGITPAQNSLTQFIDFATRTQIATTTMTLPVATPGLQFRIFDVDFSTNSFTDQVRITGTYNGNAVTPILTNGVANAVAGNTATGTGTADNATAGGTVTVTFSNPVDTVLITYGNGATAPANPDQQIIAIHDITLCNPQANLTMTKVSSVVSDGISATNPKALPGAVVRYCILVSNAGSATATNITVADAIPSRVTYIPGTMLSGTSCAGATTAEDDNATGADESDPFGVSVTGTTLTGTAASIGPASGFAIAFNATVN